MELLVNGEPREVPDGLSVASLLGHLGIDPQKVAVEVNREIVPKSRYDEQQLSPGNQVEIVQFVGGG